jgi:type 1 fimbriae regulatory protein FimB
MEKDERRHPTGLEVEKLLAATKGARSEARDRCLLLLMFRHGLRVSEAVGLKLSDLDLEGRSLHVKRLKKGLTTTQPLRSDEVRVLKAWLTERARMKPQGKALFISERRLPLSRKTAWVMIRDYGRDAGLSVASHPYAQTRLRLCACRSGCGYTADSGLSWPPEHSAHREIHRYQSRALRTVVAVGNQQCRFFRVNSSLLT